MAETTNSIWVRLLAAQKELASQSIKKEGNAQYGKYVTLNNLLDVVIPVLHKHELLLLQQPSHVEGQPALRTRFVAPDNKAEFVEDVMLLELKSPDPQAQGSAITYARRYSLMANLGLVGENEDDDGTAATIAATKPSVKVADAQDTRPASVAQVKLINTTFVRKGLVNQADTNRLLDSRGIKSLETITMSQARELIDWLFKTKSEDLQEYIIQDHHDEITTSNP